MAPQNVGIVAMEIYFPPTCIQQDTLENFDGASKGKYTIGLGQDCMAFCSEVEDVISMGLTAVTSLLEKYEIDPKQIGRLEVGSETVIDKSKSIKTFLMDIFENAGNTDIEGVDSTNACYGGTAALFNCVNWVESSSWDGRYGLVVSTDSAVYADGPARPTGGAGAVAMLIGPDAPIAFESKFRASHMSHVYDFYKPDLASEYPVVDGKLSQTCYLMALDSCYKGYCQKYEKLQGKQFSMADADYFVFHSPYNKLVQKSFARLVFADVARDASSVDESAKEKLGQFTSLKGDESYQSRDLEKASQQVAKPDYDKKVQPATLIPKQLGNMYTASLYAAFASLIHNKSSSLDGKRVMMFSYGSGLSATMWSLRLTEGKAPFSLSNIVKVMNVEHKLKTRTEFAPEKFVELMHLMEHRYGGKDFVTSKDTSHLAPGTYYLTEVDSKYRRFYAKKTTESTRSKLLGSNTGGLPWLFQLQSNQKLRKITIYATDCIISLAFTAEDSNGLLHSSPQYGGGLYGYNSNRGRKFEIKFDADEEIIGISGTIEKLASMCIMTTKKKYGPFGKKNEAGNHFSDSWDAGSFDGFYGRSGWVIDAVGCCLKPTTI